MSQLIRDVLAGVMENDINKMWEFDMFFKQIELIHRKKVGACIHVVAIDSGTST